MRLYLAEKPRAVLVAWDTLEAETYRHAAFADYQSGREFDDALVDQLDALPELVAAFGFANAKAAGYEADDFLAAAAAAEEKRGGTALIASGDRDTFQLASERTTILYPLRAGEMARIAPSEVRERYGVDPNQVPDFIALRGDPSDKLPGAAGIGPKGAATVLKQYGSLEAALKAGRFPEPGEGSSTLPLDRDDGCKGAAAARGRSDADIRQGGGARQSVGPEQARRAARRAAHSREP